MPSLEGCAAQGKLVAESESMWSRGSTRESHAQEDAQLPRGAGGPARLGTEASRHRSPYGLKCLALGPKFCLVVLTIGRFVFVCLFAFSFLGGATPCGLWDLSSLNKN